MFKELHIKNFKILKKFECKNLSTVNIFSGDNSSGKTTILEAIFLLCGYSNISLIEGVFSIFRELKLNEREDLSLFFPNLKANFNSKISIEGLFSKDKVFLGYKPYFEEGKIYGLDIEYKHNGKANGTESIRYNPQKTFVNVPMGISFEAQSPFVYSQKSQKAKVVLAQYISRHYCDTNSLNQVFREGKKRELIDLLNKLFPNDYIEDIFVIRNSIEVNTKSFENSIPLSLLGTGISKILSIFCSLVSSNEILLIDELENGLHFSKFKKVVKLIFEKAKDKGMQIFITTHSKELLNCVAELLEEDSKGTMPFSFYNVLRGENASFYKSEDFIKTMKTSFDVRK